MMITYEKPLASASRHVHESVYLQGKHVGDILMEKDASGYYYKPRGGGKRDVGFDRILDVRRSLEGIE